MKTNKSHWLLSSCAVVALLLAGSKAYATTSTCVMAVPHTSCTTGTVAANASNHFIYFIVSGGYVDYHLYDTRNGVTVAAGNSGFGGARKTVNGLYSTYRLQISGGYDIGSVGMISNE